MGLSVRANTVCVHTLTNRKPLIYKDFRDIVKPPMDKIGGSSADPEDAPATGTPGNCIITRKAGIYNDADPTQPQPQRPFRTILTVSLPLRLYFAGYFDRSADDPMEYVVMRNHIDGLLSVVLDYAAAIRTLAEGIEDTEIEKT